MQARSLLVVLAFARFAHAYEPPAPSHPVEIMRAEWNDATRDRAVPVKIYYPSDLKQPAPIVILSHGLGGSREGYEYLGKHWAGCGFVAVHVQHLGSDDAVWRDAAPAERRRALAGAAAKPINAVARPRDVSFVIDELTKANSDSSSPLNGRLNLEAIGVAGHSFGGFTAMAIAGQKSRLGADFGDPRVKAVIQMSAPVTAPKAALDRIYGGIRTPVFHMTGTRDDSPIGDTQADQRRIPFDHMKSADSCLLILEGGDHMIFSGSPRADPAAAEKDQAFHAEICRSSTAWWDAWLRHNDSAKAWLMDGPFAKELGKDGTFEARQSKK